MKTRYLHVLVDEMNIMHQLHKINVKGFRYWSDFYKQLMNLLGSPCEAHFFCANVPADDARYANRTAFLNGLKQRGIHVQEGILVRDSRAGQVEKGVDMKLGLQIYKSALQGAKDIVVCTADTDVFPAIEMAQELGSRVHLLKSDYASSKTLEQLVDSVISLETLLVPLMEQNLLRWKNKDKPFLMTNNLKNFKERGKYYGKQRISTGA